MVLRVIPPADLEPGTYTASVPVVSTVTGVVTRYILATFNYQPGPVLQVSPTIITVAGDAGGSSPAQQTVTIENAGPGTLSGLSSGPVEYGPGATGWLTASLNQTTAPALLRLQANITGLALGTYVARVPVSSSLPGITPDTVTISFGVSATSTPPTIDLSPGALSVSATAGGADPPVQNVAVTNSGGGALTDLGLGSITYGAGAGGWLTAGLAGTTAPTTLNLQAATGSLAAGTYTATVRVASSLSGVAPASTVVTFNVSGAAVPPSINLSPSNAAFTATAGSANPAPTTVDIANGGGGNLALLSLGTTSYGPGASGWLTATLGLTSAPSTVTLDPDITGLAAGTYTATVPVNSGVTGVTSKNVAVTLEILSTVTPPSIGVSPSGRPFTATAGGADPAPKTIAVSNTAGGTLTGLGFGSITYTGGATGWLTPTLDQTTAPATVTLQPHTGALAAGTYRAVVELTSPVASNSPKTFRVDLDVVGSSALAVSPSSATFTGTTGQPSPASKSLSVTDAGGGTITGLALGNIIYGGGQAGWLNAALSGTATPASLVLTATTGALPAGNYTADFSVNSSAGSKPVSVSFLVAGGSGTLAILSGDQQSGLVNTQLPAPLRARVYDAAGNPKQGVSVVWQVNNGGQLLNTTNVTDTQGEISTNWKVGPLAGTHTVDLSSAGLPTVTFEADVQLPGNPNAHPNEPAGFARFAEHNMSSLPTYPKSLGGLAGAWSTYPVGDPDLAVVTPDLTAPESPPNVFRSRFPKGLTAGHGPVFITGWDAAGNTAGQKSKIYFSLWIKILGPDFENQQAGTKMGFFGYALPPTSGAGTQSFLWLDNSSGHQGVFSQFKMQVRQELNPGFNPPYSNKNWDQNVDNRMLMTAGTWHHWELIMELNTPGQANGVLKWWIDGIQIMNYQNFTYLWSGATWK